MNPPATLAPLDHHATASGAVAVGQSMPSAGAGVHRGGVQLYVSVSYGGVTPPMDPSLTRDDPIDYAGHVAVLAGARRDDDVAPPLGGTPFGA